MSGTYQLTPSAPPAADGAHDAAPFEVQHTLHHQQQPSPEGGSAAAAAAQLLPPKARFTLALKRQAGAGDAAPDSVCAAGALSGGEEVVGVLPLPLHGGEEQQPQQRARPQATQYCPQSGWSGGARLSGADDGTGGSGGCVDEDDDEEDEADPLRRGPKQRRLTVSKIQGRAEAHKPRIGPQYQAVVPAWPALGPLPREQQE